jgi:hypothetical protein
VGQDLETLGGEGVDEGTGEQEGADQLHRGHGRRPRKGEAVIVMRIMDEFTLFHLLMRLGWRARALPGMARFCAHTSTG